MISVRFGAGSEYCCPLGVFGASVFCAGSLGAAGPPKSAAYSDVNPSCVVRADPDRCG